MQQWQYLVVCIKRCTLGWLNISPYLWLLDSPCMHCFFLIFPFSALLWRSHPLLPLLRSSMITRWDCSGCVHAAKYQRNNVHVMSVQCATALIKVRWISIHALHTYKHKLTVLQQLHVSISLALRCSAIISRVYSSIFKSASILSQIRYVVCVNMYTRWD